MRPLFAAFLGVIILFVIAATSYYVPTLAASPTQSVPVYGFKTFVTCNVESNAGLEAFDRQINDWLRNNPNIEIIRYSDVVSTGTVTVRDRNGERTVPAFVRVVSFLYRVN